MRLSLESLADRLKSLEESSTKAVLVFGSTARGESMDRSDVDILVLHKGCGIEDRIARRRHFYSLLRDIVGHHAEDITVIDLELDGFIKPMEVTPLLLNIYWDAVVVYDRTAILEDFLKKVRKRISDSGLKRVSGGRVYFWILSKPMKKVEIV